MKIISILLLFSYISFISCQTFINLLPYQTKQCKQEESIGVGYNVIANQCTMNMGNFLEFEKSLNESSFYFGISKDESGQDSVYANYFDNIYCEGIPMTYFAIGYNNECFANRLFEYINSSISYGTNDPSNYVMVTISNDEPVFPIYSQVYKVFNSSQNDQSEGSDQCDNQSKFMFSAFITNNLEIDYDNGIKETFACDSNQEPIVKYCTPNSSCKNLTPYPCQTQYGFTTTITCSSTSSE